MEMKKIDINKLIEEDLQEMEQECPRNRQLSEELTNLYYDANVTMEDVFTDLKIDEDTLADILYASDNAPVKLTEKLKAYLKSRIKQARDHECNFPIPEVPSHKSLLMEKFKSVYKAYFSKPQTEAKPKSVLFDGGTQIFLSNGSSLEKFINNGSKYSNNKIRAFSVKENTRNIQIDNELSLSLKGKEKPKIERSIYAWTGIQKNKRNLLYTAPRVYQ